MSSTTIKVSKKTRTNLDKQKLYNAEPLDVVINRLLENKLQDDILDEQTIKDIEEGLSDIKSGRVYTSEHVKKRLGLQ